MKLDFFLSSDLVIKQHVDLSPFCSLLCCGKRLQNMHCFNVLLNKIVDFCSQWHFSMIFVASPSHELAAEGRDNYSGCTRGFPKKHDVETPPMSCEVVQLTAVVTYLKR